MRVGYFDTWYVPPVLLIFGDETFLEFLRQNLWELRPKEMLLSFLTLINFFIHCVVDSGVLLISRCLAVDMLGIE